MNIGRSTLSKDYKGKDFKVEIVLLTALGVGGATVLGAVVGLLFKKTSKAANDAVMSLAAGIMLAAAMLGLILPSLEYGGAFGVFVTIIGIFTGALCVHFFDFLLIRFCRLPALSSLEGGERLRGVIVFVAAIAIHNLPEGIAAGVGFGTGDVGNAIFIATAIALQNIPEGMAVIVAMLGVGIRPWRTFLLAAMTGAIEVVGTFIGYFAVHISSAVLPFILALAGGSMLYVISDEMIPETHSREGEHRAAYFILLGFCIMLIMDAFI